MSSPWDKPQGIVSRVHFDGALARLERTLKLINSCRPGMAKARPAQWVTSHNTYRLIIFREMWCVNCHAYIHAYSLVAIVVAGRVGCSRAHKHAYCVDNSNLAVHYM